MSNDKNFWDKLQKCHEKNSSSLVVGLDPNPALLPDETGKSPEKIFDFLMQIIDATKDLVCGYKPNLAFYLSLGSEGLKILEKLRENIPENIPIILDGKFGDVGHTSEKYAEFASEIVRADAITLNPYMGKDVAAPFIERGTGVFLLCATSNPSYSDVEAILVGQIPFYEKIAQISVVWSNYFDTRFGLVVGATHPSVFENIRISAPETPFLIPGIGAQGGNLEGASKFGTTNDGIPPIIVSARGILYASHGKDFAQAARNAAIELRNKIDNQQGSIL